MQSEPDAGNAITEHRQLRVETRGYRNGENQPFFIAAGPNSY